MKTKCEFNRELYIDADEFAREKTKLAMKQQLPDYLTIEDNTDIYGIDLIIKRNDRVVGYIECERSYAWKEGKFPYKQVNLPERKEKFVDMDKNGAVVWFSMINKEGTEACLYTSRAARLKPPEFVPNTRTGGEMMRRINLSHVKQISI